MKLNVPFYVQGHNECGPVSLQMVLEFLGNKQDKDILKKNLQSESSGTTWTLDLARISAKLGFKTEFYSKSLGFNPENFNLEFYKKETDGADQAKQKLVKLQHDCLKLGVSLHEKTLSLNEVLSKINESSTAIVLLNWRIIKNQEGFTGHFLPIVGYDDKNVFVHDSGPNNATPYFAIERSLFDKARKSKGTDEDIVFINRN